MNKMNTKRNKNKCPSSHSNDKSVGSSSSKCILSEKVPEKLELKNGLVKISNEVSKEKTHNRKSKRNKLKPPNINGDSVDEKKGLESKVNSQICVEKSSVETVDESKNNKISCPLHNKVYQTTNTENTNNETDYPNGDIEYTCLCGKYPESINVDNSPLYLMLLPQKAQDGAISCCSSVTAGKHLVHSEISKVETMLEHTQSSNENILKHTKQTVDIADVSLPPCYSSSLPIENSTEVLNCQVNVETRKNVKHQSDYCCSYPSLISGPNRKSVHGSSVQETLNFETYMETVSSIMPNVQSHGSRERSASSTSLEHNGEETNREEFIELSSPTYVRMGPQITMTCPCDQYQSDFSKENNQEESTELPDPTSMRTETHITMVCPWDKYISDITGVEEKSNKEDGNFYICTKDPAESSKDYLTTSHSATLVKDNIQSVNTETDIQDLSGSVSNIRLSSDDKENFVVETAPDVKPKIEFVQYESELQMPMIMKIIQKDLSEPYSIYTYRYFIHNWPKLCFLAMCDGECVGAIVCKLDLHRKVIKRGYIAMLAVDQRYRKLRIGSNLVQMAINEMLLGDADEVVLETEVTNKPALQLYEKLGFVRDKRLFRYYLNGVDALRLKLWLR